MVIEVSGETRATAGDVRVTLGDGTYVWEGLPGTGTVEFRAGRIAIEASLTRWKSTEIIHVKGSIECPDIEHPPEIDPRIVQLLETRSGKTARRFSTFDFGREKDARAISVVVAESTAEALVDGLRLRLGSGWSAWRGTSRFVDEGSDYGVEVVVGAMRSPADILRQAHVDPVNYQMTTQDVVEMISAWHQAYGVDILQADVESVEIRFVRPVKDVPALAVEMYAFCPDVMDQGVGSMDALVEQIRKDNRVSLWWD